MCITDKIGNALLHHCIENNLSNYLVDILSIAVFRFSRLLHIENKTIFFADQRFGHFEGPMFTTD